MGLLVADLISGKYKFTLSGKQLTFTKVKDSCSGRPDVLANTFKHTS